MALPLERLGLVRDPEAESKELRELREHLQLTQLQAATLLDVSPTTYYRWESGKKAPWFCAIELMRCWAREPQAKKVRSKRRGA